MMGYYLSLKGDTFRETDLPPIQITYALLFTQQTVCHPTNHDTGSAYFGWRHFLCLTVPKYGK